MESVSVACIDEGAIAEEAPADSHGFGCKAEGESWLR